jgi:hypothetical protein
MLKGSKNLIRDCVRLLEGSLLGIGPQCSVRKTDTEIEIIKSASIHDQGNPFVNVISDICSKFRKKYGTVGFSFFLKMISYKVNREDLLYWRI